MKALEPDQKLRDPDQRVRLHGLSWDQYEALLQMRGESSGVRIAYLKGEVELMSPSRSHEWIKTTLARLLEAWAEEKDVELGGVGSWTLKSAPEERGAEPDECYIVGTKETDRPDIAIEVVWTSGGIDKLEIYRGLKVREVWFWEDGRIQVYALRAAGYEPVPRSEVLPDVDLVAMVRFLEEEGQTAAVRAWRKWLRGE
ncbi:MAG: Uma2 family endonuclease [Myxococcota bacterium]